MRAGGERKVGYLGRAKVRALLLVSIVEALQEIIMTATDKLIIGNIIGADGVSGTMLIYPIFTLGQAFEIMIGSGASVLYIRAVGDYDDEKRRRVMGMSSVVAMAFGLFMCISSLVCGDLFFDAMGAEGIIRTYGEEYFYFYRFSFLITPLLSFLSEIVYIDGDGFRALMSGIGMLIGNAVLSLILTLKIGIIGASLGSAIGTVLALAVVLSHFLVKKYRIRPVFQFNADDLREMFIVGGADSLNCVFDFVYSFLLNIFIIRMFGEKYLAVLAVTSIVYEMMEIGGGVNDAMKTMLLSYRGDRNTRAMRSLTMYGFKVTLIMGTVFIAVIWIAAPLFPVAYGMEPGELANLTAWACRLTALSAVACVFNGVFLEYYLNIGKYKLQIFGNLLDTLVVRLILNVLCACAFGAVGIWIGESICTYVSVALMMAFIYLHYGRDSFPFLLRESGKNTLNLSFCAVPEEIVTARDRLEEFLNEMRIPGRARNLAMLFLEDISVLIREGNASDKTVNVDAYFICGRESMNVVIWSDGEVMDLTDEARGSEGLAGYLVSSLMRGFDESKYQNTAGYNRASFVIPYRGSHDKA